MPPTFVTYLDIADDLHHQVEQGIYPPGERIPSYRQLADTYRVHASTAQRAVALLRDRGVVVGHTGRGVYVTEPAPRPNRINHRPRPPSHTAGDTTTAANAEKTPPGR